MTQQFSSPILISEQRESVTLQRVPLSATADDTRYDEAWLQELVFKHPECLPISEIDQSYAGLIAVCKELNTPVGPIDVLYATPQGKLVVLEAKLWRNPEARRKVVGQILDYAKELSRWSYEDMQREVSRATKTTGNALYDIVAAHAPDTQEQAFVDEVSRSLRSGRFLLLIAGDGIREGVGAIADFLQQHGTLHFTFGLVEMAIFKTPDSGHLVQPRVLAQSVIVKRTVVSLADESLVADEEGDEEDEEDDLTELSRFYKDFWPEFLSELKLDDVAQPMASPTKQGNIFFMMPSGSDSWITVFFSQRSRRVGLFLTFRRGAFADMAYQRLLEDREEIDRELGIPVEWQSESGKHKIVSSVPFPDLLAPDHRAEIKAWLADQINRFVNVFRHRIERIAEES